MTDEELTADGNWCPECGCPREACTCQHEPMITAHICGPQGECGCKCPDGPCGHVWGNEPKDMGDGAYSVVCVNCGMSAMQHSLWVGP